MTIAVKSSSQACKTHSTALRQRATVAGESGRGLGTETGRTGDAASDRGLVSATIENVREIETGTGITKTATVTARGRGAVGEIVNGIESVIESGRGNESIVSVVRRAHREAGGQSHPPPWNRPNPNRGLTTRSATATESVTVNANVNGSVPRGNDRSVRTGTGSGRGNGRSETESGQRGNGTRPGRGQRGNETRPGSENGRESRRGSVTRLANGTLHGRESGTGNGRRRPTETGSAPNAPHAATKCATLSYRYIEYVTLPGNEIFYSMVLW